MSNTLKRSLPGLLALAVFMAMFPAIVSAQTPTATATPTAVATAAPAPAKTGSGGVMSSSDTLPIASTFVLVTVLAVGVTASRRLTRSRI